LCTDSCDYNGSITHTIAYKSINQSIKFNSGCLAHKEKTHTSTKKAKKKKEKLNYKTLQLHYQ